MPPQHFAIPKILNGQLKIKKIEIGNLIIDSNEECLLFQEAIIIGKRGYGKNLQKPYSSYGGKLITSNGIELWISVLASDKVSENICLTFRDIDDEDYEMKMPRIILQKFYKNQLQPAIMEADNKP